MVQLIRPTKVSVRTVEGECNVHITLDLNIHLDSDGLKVSAGLTNDEEESGKRMVPDFKHEKITFGQKVT